MKKWSIALFSGLVGLALLPATAAQAQDEGFVVTLASQKMGPVNTRVVYEPGTHRMYISSDRQIFRLSSDRRHFEHIAGIAEGGNPDVLNLEVHPRAASITPNSIAVHPETRQLYFADARTHRIFRISIDGQRIEHVAGSGSTDFQGGDLLHGDARTANLAPSALAFHPGTHELYFVNAGRRIFKLIESPQWVRYKIVAGAAPGQGNAEIPGRAREDGTAWLNTVMSPHHLMFNPTSHELFYEERTQDGQITVSWLLADGTTRGRKFWLRSFGFDPDGRSVFGYAGGRFGGRDSEIERIDLATGESRKYDVGTSIVGERFGSVVSDHLTGGFYFAFSPGSNFGHEIRRVGPTGRRIDLVTGVFPGARNSEMQEAELAEVWSGDTLHLLEVDSATGNLIFLDFVPNRNWIGNVSVRTFILGDDFGDRLRGQLKAAKAALRNSDQAEFERIYSDVKLLSGPPANLLLTVDKTAKSGRFSLPPNCQLPPALLAPPRGGYHLPVGVPALIAEQVTRDPHQPFRELRAQHCLTRLCNMAYHHDGVEKLVREHRFKSPALYAVIRERWKILESRGHRRRATSLLGHAQHEIADALFSQYYDREIAAGGDPDYGDYHDDFDQELNKKLQAFGWSQEDALRAVNFLQSWLLEGDGVDGVDPGDGAKLVAAIRRHDPSHGESADKLEAEIIGLKGDDFAATISLNVMEYLATKVRLFEYHSSRSAESKGERLSEDEGRKIKRDREEAQLNADGSIRETQRAKPGSDDEGDDDPEPMDLR